MIKERVIQIIDYKEIAKERFFEKIGMTSANFRGKAKETPLNSNAIENILSEIPDLNINWLLTGKGKMLNSKKVEIGSGIPLVPIEALAGKGSGELQILENEIENRYYVPEFAKADFLIKVKGSSMYPKYSSGDILACIRTDKGKWGRLPWNKTFVLDTDTGIMVKRILKGIDSQHWILRSDNKEYQDIDMPIDAVYTISEVIGVIRFE